MINLALVILIFSDHRSENFQLMYVRPRFFFICWIILHLLKFQSAVIGKKTTDVLVNSSGVLYYVSDNFSKKCEICLQDNLGLFLFVGLGFFFICWITCNRLGIFSIYQYIQYVTSSLLNVCDVNLLLFFHIIIFLT